VKNNPDRRQLRIWYAATYANC